MSDEYKDDNEKVEFTPTHQDAEERILDTDMEFLDEGDDNTEEEHTTQRENHFTLRSEQHDPIRPKDDNFDRSSALPLLDRHIDDMTDTEISDPKDFAGTKEEVGEWADVSQLYFASEMGNDQPFIVTRERMSNGDFRQVLATPDGAVVLPVNLRNPKVASTQSTLSHKEAASALDEATDLCSTVLVNVLSCGFSLIMNRPKLMPIARLFNKIATDKRVVGLSTGGIGYNNQSAYFDKHLLDFIKSHTVKTNIEKFKVDNLEEVLTDQGMDEILLALSAVTHQKGFDFSRACTADPTKCVHVEEGKIDIADSIWVDNALFSDEQVEYWASSNRQSRKLKQVQEYQQRFALRDEEFWASDRIKIVCEFPSVKERLRQADDWLQDMQRSIQNAFASEPSERERYNYLMEQQDMAMVSNYVSYIKEVQIYNEDKSDFSTITDKTAIRDHLDGYIGVNETLVNNVTKGIYTFQSKNRLVFFGTPNYDCPKCGGAQSDGSGPYGIIIPHGVKQTFTNLASLRIKGRPQVR
jgi:hypothetical protein